jgi:Myosin head (motor domain)
MQRSTHTSAQCSSLSIHFAVARFSIRPGLANLSADLGIYTEEVLERYRGKNRLEVPPHVFGIAESAYYNMNAYHENQCVIITGESGAGKTEAAKRIMQYIAAVSGGQDSGIQEIKDMVLATNPLLESFGCAKTLRNNNSSRHVSWSLEEVGVYVDPYTGEIS